MLVVETEFDHQAPWLDCTKVRTNQQRKCYGSNKAYDTSFVLTHVNERVSN